MTTWTWLRGGARALRISTLLLMALSRPTPAQLISIKTVPIAQGDQFAIFPSNNFGMGGVSIALADTLLDPFVNPAKGARVGAARFFSAPTIYGISQGAGGGRTLPLATIAASDVWFGGLALALQQVDASKPPFDQGGVFVAAPLPAGQVAPTLATVPPRQDSYGNQYFFAMAGRRVPRAPLALAGSALWGRLTGVDGVRLLYARSAGGQTVGHAADPRARALEKM